MAWSELWNCNYHPFKISFVLNELVLSVSRRGNHSKLSGGPDTLNGIFVQGISSFPWCMVEVVLFPWGVSARTRYNKKRSFLNFCCICFNTFILRCRLLLYELDINYDDIRCCRCCLWLKLMILSRKLCLSWATTVVSCVMKNIIGFDFNYISQIFKASQ